MSTKNNPGAYDCHGNAEPDEEMFIILGRDRLGAWMVRVWCYMRIRLFFNNPHDPQIVEALACADRMAAWCKKKGKKPL